MTPPSFPSTGLRDACDACGLRHDDIDAVVRHADHVALGLGALEARQLRSHLFALLAALGAFGLADDE